MLWLDRESRHMGDRSVDARDIKQSVVVTGGGNNVALTFGDTGIRLPLRRKQFPPPERRRPPRKGEPPRELDFLVPEAGKLPLVGRKDRFVELQAWFDDLADISVYALIGRAGTGKTRLAIEFCRTIDSDPAGNGKWVAGFLSPADLDSVVEALTTHSFIWERNTLLVIDYAAQCHQALARWLDRLADQKLDTKLRFLLLDREAPEAFGWWRDLAVLGPPSRRELFHELRLRPLPDLADLEERRALMEAALSAARGIRSEASDAMPIPAKDVDPDFDRRLNGTQFGNPLNLVMAGLIALHRGPRAALGLRRLDSARHIARRELRRFSDLARSRQIGEDEIRHIVAFNGVVGGLPIADLRKTVADELAASRRSTDRLDAVLTLLQQELPPRTEASDQRRIATIQPDLIGEAAIVEAFTGDPAREAEAAEVVRRGYALDGASAAQSLFRVVQDFAYPIEDPDAEDEEKTTGRRIMDWLLNLAEKIEDPEQLVPLAAALPEKTTILLEPAVQLSGRLAELFRAQAESTNDSVAWLNAAAWLNNLSVRAIAGGSGDQALWAAEYSVRIYRALVEARPEIFLPDLARALCNLAIGFGAVGQLEQALVAAEESVGIYRSCGASPHTPLASELAVSLNELARLRNLGRIEGAFVAAEESVRIRRALAETDPDVFTPVLASSLNAFANTLSALGRRKEALAAGDEAVRLYRGLADRRPDAFMLDLAVSLGNLANKLGDVGRHEQAVIATEEAVRLGRGLAKARPDAFSRYLSTFLNNLAALLRDLGRHEEALVAAEEAVRLRRALANAQPDVFQSSLASSLGNLANTLADLGRHQEALTAAEEAADLYRRLAETRYEAFAPDLAISLNNLANRLSDLGRFDRALLVAEKAVHLYRALADARPEAFKRYLAGALNNLAIRLKDMGRQDQALAISGQAVDAYGELVKVWPEAFATELAQSLWVQGDLYSRVGNPELAMQAAAAGIRLLFPVFAKTPAAVGRIMVALVQSYYAHCASLAREPDAELVGQALAVFESLSAREGKE
jgi:tetratricopeptide (TPR) repeat protein